MPTIQLGNFIFEYIQRDSGSIDVIKSFYINKEKKVKCKGTCGVIVCKECMKNLDTVLKF